MERNRMSEQLYLLEADPRYAWTARKRGEWKPPVEGAANPAVSIQFRIVLEDAVPERQQSGLAA